MPVTILLDYEMEPAQADEYAAGLAGKFVATRSFDGCEGIAAYRDDAAPGRFVIIQHWVSYAHYERYIAWRKETGGLTDLAQTVRASNMRRLSCVA